MGKFVCNCPSAPFLGKGRDAKHSINCAIHGNDPSNGKRCPCGGVILADTEDLKVPLCANCYFDTLAVSRWCPIGTAPRDGTEVLVLSGSRVDIAAFKYQRWRCANGSLWGESIYTPDFWMPLPPPPEVKE